VSFGPPARAPAGSHKLALALLLLVAAAATALGLSHVARRHQAVRLGYELATETSRLHELEEENRRLRLERSMLRHPDRLEEFAESARLAPPRPDQLRVVRRRWPTVAAQ
jgi:cell division protein FtsL